VYHSTDKGNSWALVNNGLTNTSINSIASNKSNIYVGTGNGGVYRAYLSSFGINDVKEKNILNDELVISPNPCGDYIDLDVKSESKIDLSKSNIMIYNIVGEMIKSVGSQNSEHQRIDVSALPSGFYILKLDNLVKKFVKE